MVPATGRGAQGNLVGVWRVWIAYLRMGRVWRARKGEGIQRRKVREGQSGTNGRDICLAQSWIQHLVGAC